MILPLYIVNAFTRHMFGGNPAAVCPLDNWLTDNQMQQIAAQHNLSETAFFVGSDNEFHIRWFTPQTEVALCGHATLASAFVIFSQPDMLSKQIHFTSHSGALSVTHKNELFTLDFPAQPPRAVPVDPDIAKALGAAPSAMLTGEDLLLVFDHETDVAQLKPDFAALKSLSYRGILATAPGDQNDFVCRFFAPAVGIDEDPVTGSAFTKLAPYWCQRLEKSVLRARQISARGGDVICELIDDRVHISGAAVLYAKGEIFLQD